MIKNSFAVIVLTLVIVSCAPVVDEGIDPWAQDDNQGIKNDGGNQDVPKVPDNPDEDEENTSDTDDEIPDNVSDAKDSEEEIEKDEEDVPVEEVEDTQGDFLLTAQKNENSVVLEWEPFSGDDFQYYKVVRSVVDATPTYKEEGYIETIVDINTTTYTDNNPKPGISYYAVTAVRQLSRYENSNPVKIEYPNPAETPDQTIELSAEIVEGGVLLKWDAYEGEFLQYKLVRATKHPYPKYPEDDLIETVPFANETEYIDRQAKSGMNYYGVTIIRPDKSRFTSQRASIEVQ